MPGHLDQNNELHLHYKTKYITISYPVRKQPQAADTTVAYVWPLIMANEGLPSGCFAERRLGETSREMWNDHRKRINKSEWLRDL